MVRPIPHVAATDTSQHQFYLIGAVATLLAALAVVSDIVLSVLIGGALPQPGTATVFDWFALFERNTFLGLYGLGVLNLIYTLLLIPIFLALYVAFRPTSPAAAALALVLFLIGTAIYIANNAALPLLDLSRQYANASGEAERSLLAAAGQTLVSRAEDFTPGAFLSFSLLEVAEVLMAAVMLRSALFTRLTGWLGMLGFVLLAIFTVWATFIPYFYTLALLVATIGGFATIGWFLLVAHRLFQLGHSLPQKAG